MGTLIATMASGAALAVALLLATTAQAAVNISADPTQNMSCSGGVCRATAQDAWLNVNDLTNMLASGDVTVATGDATALDIHVQAAFSWTSGSRLTLDSQRNIEFQQPVTVAGVGGLTLITNDGGTGGDYWFDKGASVTFWDTFGSLIINGTPFKLATDLASLASGVAAYPSASFALANDYDASVDGTYKNAVVTATAYHPFEGLGHTISNLSLKNTKKKGLLLGLFAQVDAIRDLAVTNMHVVSQTGAGSVTGTLAAALGYGGMIHCSADGVVKASQGIAGGLIGQNSGAITDVSVHSSVSVAGPGYAGGLAGQTGGSVTNASVSSKVSVGAPGSAGGLAGYSTGGVNSSSSKGSVSGAGIDSNSTVLVGGLVGTAGYVVNSSSTSKVTITSYGIGGGLVGAAGFISNSHASGDVSGGDYTTLGGLAGSNNRGRIEASYATGKVSAGANATAGGLAGVSGSDYNTQTQIDTSFATGDVTAGSSSKAGGLAGNVWLTGGTNTVTDAYSTGAVTTGTDSETGGALGAKDHWVKVEKVYSLGAVSSQSGSTGGFIGFDKAFRDKPNHINAAVWDLDTSGISDPTQGAGNIPNDPNITGVSDAQLKSGLPAGFNPKVWGQDANINNGYPYLLANPPPQNAPAKARAKSHPNHGAKTSIRPKVTRH